MSVQCQHQELKNQRLAGFTSASLCAFCVISVSSSAISKIPGYTPASLCLSALCFACKPSQPWRKSSLGGSLENEDSAGHVREALDHRVDRLSSCSVKLEGRDKFPPFSGMCIEQMLHAVETGMVVRGQLRDFVL